MASTAEAQDPRTAARIHARVDRLIGGNPGDTEPIGGGLSERRIHHSAGYRVYYWQQGDVLLILLCGGDRSSQDKGHQAGAQDGEGWEHRGNSVQVLRLG
jgi:putative addiction module killer protein